VSIIRKIIYFFLNKKEDPIKETAKVHLRSIVNTKEQLELNKALTSENKKEENTN
jgi:hypothetical protein